MNPTDETEKTTVLVKMTWRKSEVVFMSEIQKTTKVKIKANAKLSNEIQAQIFGQIFQILEIQKQKRSTTKVKTKGKNEITK